MPSLNSATQVWGPGDIMIRHFCPPRHLKSSFLIFEQHVRLGKVQNIWGITKILKFNVYGNYKKT